MHLRGRVRLGGLLCVLALAALVVSAADAAGPESTHAAASEQGGRAGATAPRRIRRPGGATPRRIGEGAGGRRSPPRPTGAPAGGGCSGPDRGRKAGTGDATGRGPPPHRRRHDQPTRELDGKE